MLVEGRQHDNSQPRIDVRSESFATSTCPRTLSASLLTLRVFVRVTPETLGQYIL